MAGVEKLTAYIEEEAKTEASRIIDEANKASEDALKKAREEIEKEAQASKANADLKSQNKKVRFDSQCAQEEKLILLKKRQEIIDGILDKALLKLEALPDGEYFEMLLKLLDKSLEKGDCEMLLSEKDLKRVPSGFEEKANAKAAALGGSLKLSDEPAKIGSGFVLRYGFIEINSSLKAIFDDRRDELQDTVNSILW